MTAFQRMRSLSQKFFFYAVYININRRRKIESVVTLPKWEGAISTPPYPIEESNGNRYSIEEPKNSEV